MEEKANKNLAYKYSEILKQKIAFDRTSGCIICEDGSSYSAAEINLIKISQRPLPFQIHIVKKAFSGTIINVPGL